MDCCRSYSHIHKLEFCNPCAASVVNVLLYDSRTVGVLTTLTIAHSVLPYFVGVFLDFRSYSAAQVFEFFDEETL
jgi:hypothetical protein